MAELIYVDDNLPGITRKGAGKGWAYYDPKGNLIRDRKERERLNAIALPPAYTDAWFCPAPNGHILATGKDARGRKQYRYHPQFRIQQEASKFDNCIAFGRLLPLVRKRVADDLSQRALTRERAIASVVRLLDLGAVRVGHEAYTKSNKSFGATTLQQDHLKLTGKTLRLSYKGKGGQDRKVSVTDASLARAVRRMQDLPGQNLFQFVDDNDTLHPVGSGDVNDYIAETMGERFTAKNFRTWHASVEGLQCIAEAEGQLQISDMLECVAQKLGNTPAVTRKSYIHPAVLALLDDESLDQEIPPMPRATQWLSREERLLINLLEEAPEAEKLLAA